MRLHEEIYLDITVEGKKADVEKFIAYITSGELDDYLELSDELLLYCDEFDSKGSEEQVNVTISNDNYGFEIDSFDPEEFLDAFCGGGRNVFIHGQIYDIEDEEYRFVSNIGDPSYENAAQITYKDELDIEAARECDDDANDD